MDIHKTQVRVSLSFDMRVNRGNTGFTLIEMIVVLGVLATLMSIGAVSVLRLQRHTHIQTVIATFVADVYEQRQRAMSADTQGRSTTDQYGIHFGSAAYTLFHGSSYVASDSANVVIPLQSPVNIAQTTFPNQTIIFQKGSGEILSFSQNANTLTFQNNANMEQISVSFNQYGTITSQLP